MATIRIDDDVNTALKKRAGDQSATKVANHLLRVGLGLVASPTTRVSNAPKRRPDVEVKPADCPHPPGRLLNGHCMACGSKVKAS